MAPSLQTLPAELLRLIIEDSGLRQKDLAVLTRTCDFFYQIVTPYLYRHDIKHNNSSALIWAAEHSQLRTARRALELGADPNTKGPQFPESRDFSNDPCYNGICTVQDHRPYGSPLHFAANEGNDAMVNLLLDYGARTDASSEHVCGCGGHWTDEQRADCFPPGWFPLHHAVCKGHITTAHVLLDRGAPTQMASEQENDSRSRLSGHNLLHCAAAHGLEDLVKRALEMEPTLAKKKTMESPLHYAIASWNSEGIIRRLREAGADLEETEDRGMMTPLYRACYFANYTTALHLLRAGAQLRPPLSERPPASRMPLLHLALQINRPFPKHHPRPPAKGRIDEQIEFVRVLVEEYGWDVNEMYEGCTPLLRVFRGNGFDKNLSINPFLATKLIGMGADPNITDAQNLTPLVLAVELFVSKSHQEFEENRRPIAKMIWKLINALCNVGARLDIESKRGTALGITANEIVRGNKMGEILFESLVSHSTPKTLSDKHWDEVHARIFEGYNRFKRCLHILKDA